MSLLKWIEFTPLGDVRGSLVAVEGARTIPFDIRRVYYIFGTQEKVVRGLHAHRSLKQVVICVTGECKMILDDGHTREECLLNSPVRGLVIEGLVWREMFDFSPDCVLLVLASEHYDETDYIREYSEFLSEASDA